jgi:polyisoprenoid-binding protein YceI
MGAMATTTIDRQDFDVSFSKTMDGGGLVVGNEVRLTLRIELKKEAAE